MSRWSVWADEEMEFLAANHKTMNRRDIAEALGNKTAQQVSEKLSRMGLASRHGRIEDLDPMYGCCKVGESFGRLMVVGPAPPLVSRGKRYRRVLCRCECGEEATVVMATLRRGKKLSCGCLGFEMGIGANTTHGMSGTRLHRVWLYRRGRNELCDAWANDFQTFFDWATATGYDDGMTVGRVDRDKCFGPLNCVLCPWLPVIRKESKPVVWTDAELSILKASHKAMSRRDIANKLGTKTEKQVRDKLQKLGLASRATWHERNEAMYGCKVGDVFGLLTVIGPPEVVEAYGKRQRQALCRCECGEEVWAMVTALRHDRKTSCGCYAMQRRFKHGMSKTRLYRVWYGLRRTAGVCQPWADDFRKFHEWSMANGYEDGMKINRRDLGGPFKPSNCYWAMPDQPRTTQPDKSALDVEGLNSLVRYIREGGSVDLESLG